MVVERKLFSGDDLDCPEDLILHDHSESAESTSGDGPSPSLDEANTQFSTPFSPASHIPPAAGPDTSGPVSSKLDYFARIDKAAERQRLRQHPEGKVLRGRFRLVKTLGSGGMGDVYLAKDLLREEMEDSTPHVAVKLLNEDAEGFEGALQALQREAKKSQALSHPNIVTVYDFDRCGDSAFISMEYLQGCTLKEYLVEHGTMSPSKAMRVIELAARGLAYAHQEGFVHADIKPANIFLLDDGSVKILDFGIARAINRPSGALTVGEQLTEFALTPNFATVESLQGDPLSARDDVFALGCVAYQLLSGRHPYTEKNGLPVPADEALARGLRVEPLIGVSPRHMRALKKALKLENSGAFANAGEFIDAIKPPAYRRALMSAAVACMLLTGIWLGVSAYLNHRVPTITALPGNMANIAALIGEGDQFLLSEDIDQAYRLYAQAWYQAQQQSGRYIPEDMQSLRTIVAERTNRVAERLVKLSQSDNLTELQMREFVVALELFLKTEFVKRPHKLRESIALLKRRLAG